MNFLIKTSVYCCLPAHGYKPTVQRHIERNHFHLSDPGFLLTLPNHRSLRQKIHCITPSPIGKWNLYVYAHEKQVYDEYLRKILVRNADVFQSSVSQHNHWIQGFSHHKRMQYKGTGREQRVKKILKHQQNIKTHYIICQRAKDRVKERFKRAWLARVETK